MFISITAFPGQQDGDLCFSQGIYIYKYYINLYINIFDIYFKIKLFLFIFYYIYMRIGEMIIGLQSVGSGWYLGQIDTKKGIFPLTHVWQLDTKLLKVCLLYKLIF